MCIFLPALECVRSSADSCNCHTQLHRRYSALGGTRGLGTLLREVEHGRSFQTRHDTPATSRGVTIVARPKSLEVRTTPDLCTNSPLKERRWWEISDEASAHAFTPTYLK
ncbi:hypothetical protein T4A_8682 [Trichinella pseudospiralis]|uniref:Uncharacterized protein n=1 Tax=Trichinella pseudospiralis TaxID=6337 RepID=A0A0V1ER84_TRIPS|nr:hypothetical protein T4A_8682 [Trichinella pseudospiralis]